jgi:hypothetical protein
MAAFFSCRSSTIAIINTGAPTLSPSPRQGSKLNSLLEKYQKPDLNQG